LTRRAANEDAFERGRNSLRKRFNSLFDPRDITSMEGRTEDLPLRTVSAKRTAEQFIELEGALVLEAGGLKPQVHAAAAREEADHRHIGGLPPQIFQLRRWATNPSSFAASFICEIFIGGAIPL
jgi:hypothetical protein